jgi:SagB-type dehydrogenase family enzyme
MEISLEQALKARATARRLSPCTLTLDSLATLLYYAYGINRDNQDTNYVRPLRVVPSGGALYPIEIYFHTTHTEGLPAGLYHYNPEQRNIRLLRESDETEKITQAMVYQHIAQGAAATIFITGMFQRSIYKYGDRGYRFTLIEAGHIAQNINLVSTGLGLGCMLVGGFYDRQIDDLLELDGLLNSTIYIAAIGKNEK